MKKISIIALALILCFALVACGRKDKTPATTTPTQDTGMIPGLDPTILDPTIDTNIPDPNVDTSMPDFTDGTDGTQSGSSNGNNNSNTSGTN